VSSSEPEAGILKVINAEMQPLGNLQMETFDNVLKAQSEHAQSTYKREQFFGQVLRTTSALL
jgi:hypothetical protein